MGSRRVGKATLTPNRSIPTRQFWSGAIPRPPGSSPISVWSGPESPSFPPRQKAPPKWGPRGATIVRAQATGERQLALPSGPHPSCDWFPGPFDSRNRFAVGERSDSASGPSELLSESRGASRFRVERLHNHNSDDRSVAVDSSDGAFRRRRTCVDASWRGRRYAWVVGFAWISHPPQGAPEPRAEQGFATSQIRWCVFHRRGIWSVAVPEPRHAPTSGVAGNGSFASLTFPS